MKTILKILPALLLIFSSLACLGQVKLGHLNSDELIVLMPEYISAQSQLEEYEKSIIKDIEQMYAEYESKVANFQANERLMTDITKETRIKEITDLETRIREYEAKAQEDLQKKQVELISPVFEKAQSAIDAVAKESGFTYVFDTSKGVVLFANDSEDILILVKKKLGI